MHEMRIIHFDIKASNVTIGREDAQVKIIDFGVAKFVPENSNGIDNEYYTSVAPPETRVEPTPRATLGVTDLWAAMRIIFVILTGGVGGMYFCFSPTSTSSFDTNLRIRRLRYHEDVC